jgi:glycosyltransferase involved in cell wall biosynthesis
MKFIGCAVGETRKGLDRFINIASLLPEHEFGWIGDCNIVNDKVNIFGHGYFEDLIRKIPNNLKFYGLLQDSKSTMEQYDVFLFLSREDACPLVIFEAKEIGLKVITLKDSSDSHKFLTDNDHIIEGQYSDIKILDCIKNIKNTNKIPHYHKSNSLSKILDVINYGLSYERNLFFNGGWYQIEENHVFFSENAEI